MAIGWYLLPSGQAFYGTIPTGATPISEPPLSGDMVDMPRADLVVPGLTRLRQKVAVARSGGLAAQLIWIGDSVSEGFASTRYRNRFLDRIRRRMQGSTRGTLGFLPATAGTLNGLLDADWAGGDNPWTFAGSVTGNGTYGIGFHSVNIPSGGGSATFTYFGDRFGLNYARTTTGPTACAVTLDSVSVGPINANGANLGGQAFGPAGTHGAYGFHTVVITPNDGTLVLEGATAFDGDAPFFLTGTVQMIDATHSGFGANSWADPANNNWSSVIQGGETFVGGIVIMLGLNDFNNFGRTPTQFKDDLVTITQRIDTRLGLSTTPYLLIVPPGVTGGSQVDAYHKAAERIGLERCSVLDIGALRSGRTLGTDLESGHPTDAGQIWLADAIGDFLDPSPPAPPAPTPKQIVIEASQPTDSRTSWTEAWTALTGGQGGYDASGGGTTVGERKHALWLDAGTYRATVTMQEDTGLATVEVLIGNYQGATATLTSCGTKANAAGSPTLVTTRLGTSVTTQVPGWQPVVIRKTSASGAIRFVRLVIDKTA